LIPLGLDGILTGRSVKRVRKMQKRQGLDGECERREVEGRDWEGRGDALGEGDFENSRPVILWISQIANTEMVPELGAARAELRG
jgi:hypothetical protein